MEKTLEELKSLRHKLDEQRRASVDYIYASRRRWIEPLKVRFQMGIGVYVILQIGALGLRAVTGRKLCDLLERVFPDVPVLKAVGAALAVSAAVELAYMLFTPGPDEAIEPVILGLSSAVLLIVSSEGLGLRESLSIGVLVLGIIGLFWARKTFLTSEHEPN